MEKNMRRIPSWLRHAWTWLNTVIKTAAAATGAAFCRAWTWLKSVTKKAAAATGAVLRRAWTTWRSAAYAETRFIWRTVAICTVLGVLTAAALMLYPKIEQPQRVKRIEEALASGAYETALSLTDGVQDAAQKEAFSQRCQYGLAQKRLEDGDYDEAAAAFRLLGDYQDARSMVKECAYRSACVLFDAGDYGAALESFAALSAYSDAAERYDACEFALAQEAEAAGAYKEALERYVSLGTYQDAQARACALAVRITGEPDPDRALPLALGYSEAEIAAQERLTTIRNELPLCRIATGFYHTLGVCANGTVLAVGCNEDGQCDTAAWRDVTAVAAGAYHSVGLTADGHVLACGRNDESQCAVAAWTNVVAVACTDYGTLGLTEKGTILYSGYDNADALIGLQDAVTIGAGSYLAFALRENGRLLATHPSGTVSTDGTIVAASVTTGCLAALCADGTVACDSVDLSDWTDVVFVCASPNGCFGLTVDGRVLEKPFQARDAIDLSDVTNGVLLAAHGTHVAVLLRDGTVLCRGDNTYGQCDTAGWRLFD